MKIAFDAILSGLRTTVDGGIKLTFDAHAQNNDDIANLLRYNGKALYLVIMDKDELINDAENK